MRHSDVGFGGHLVGNAFHLSLLYKVNNMKIVVVITCIQKLKLML